jgi:hypothetical protein
MYGFVNFFSGPFIFVKGGKKNVKKKEKIGD